MTGASMHCADGLAEPLPKVHPRASFQAFLRAAGQAAVVLLLAMLGLVCLPASAHKSSDSYLQLDSRADGLSLRWDIALRDIDAAIDLDPNADGKLTWGEVKAAWPQIDAYVLPRLTVDGCPLTLVRHSLEHRNDGTYAVLWLTSPCVLNASPAIGYSLFREIDPTHRGIARIDRAGAPLQVRVIDPHATPAVASASLASSASTTASATGTPQDSGGIGASFLVEGMEHILGGYDHVLFLLSLLLPSVLHRTPKGLRPVDNLWQAVLPVAGIVTAFTIAHSITLGLAALKLVSLPSSFIEPAIAVTIMVAALDNVAHLFGGHRAVVTFCFGLVHGFGFAGVLSELNLPTADFALALFEFNVGLELGQLSIVAVAVGLLYGVRHWRGYQRWIVQGGSLVAGVIALVWFVERVSGYKWLAI